MEKPLDGLSCSNAVAVAAKGSECGTPKVISRQNGLADVVVVFPKELRGQNGCRYERINEEEEGNDAVYVPFGASHAKDVLGWKAKHDKRKNKLFFIRLSDTTEKTWRLPLVPEAVLRVHGVLSGGSVNKNGFSAEHAGKADKPLGGNSENCIVSDDYEDIGGELLEDEQCDDASFFSHRPESGGSETDVGLPTGNTTKTTTQTQHHPLPLMEYNGALSDNGDMPRNRDKLSTSRDEEAAPTDARLLLNVAYREGGAVTPLEKQSFGSSKLLFRDQNLSDSGGNSGICKESDALLLQRDTLVSDAAAAAAAAAAGPCLVEEPKNDRGEDHRVAQIAVEKEEVGRQSARWNAALCMLDEGGMLLGEQCGEREVSQSGKGGRKPRQGVPSLEELAEDDDVFLRNTRLSGFDDDEAVTPLEKLLRDGSLDGRWGQQQQQQCHGNAMETGAYANIYQPSSGTSDGTLTPRQSSGLALLERQVKNIPPDTHEKPRDGRLTPRWLFEAQRHQMEVERRLTQRDRDNMERAIDVRCQHIIIPTDCHSQLRYEPSDHFTRGRQALLDALGIAGNSPPQGEASFPHDGVKQTHQYQQQQQQGCKAPSQPQEFQSAHAPSAGVSPISDKTFIHSPSPPKLLGPDQGRWCETVVTEAYEAKYGEGLSAMQKLMELYQLFVATKPHQHLPSTVSHSAIDECYMNNGAESSAERYAELLLRIKDLYAHPDTESLPVHHHYQHKTHHHYHNHHRLICTPPIPLSMSYDNVESRAARQGPIQTPVRGHTECGSSTRHAQGGSVDGCAFFLWQMSAAVLRRQGIKTPRLPFGLETEGGEKGRGDASRHVRSSEVVASSTAPHRHLLTPPPTLQLEFLPVNETVSVSHPVLRWDAKRCGNVLISPKGTTCLADASRALHLVATEEERTGKSLPNVFVPMYALGTIGVSEGEFIFEVRVDHHPSSTHKPGDVFAVGVTTKYYKGAHKDSPAYLFRSDGRIMSSAADWKGGVPYGSPYHSGAHITVHLNLVQHELSFFLNGRSLGVAFRFKAVEDPEPLFPLVVLVREGDTATFVPPSAPQLPPHVGPLFQAYKPAICAVN